MPITCNINARGKFVRLIYGIIFAITGLALLLFWAIPSGGVIRWIVALVLILGGAFAIFEARAGWCVVRAMGFKTPF